MATGNIGKIKASRVNGVPNVESYLGEKGVLFFNFANGVIRLSDGVTPGGVPIAYNIASNVTIGGIKAGPGANVASDGTLTIDTSGLPLSIGNLEIANTTISTLQSDVNLNLVTNGMGDINLVGNVHIHATQDPDDPQPLFSFSSSNVFTANGNVVANGNLITNGNTTLNGSTVVNGALTNNGPTYNYGLQYQTGDLYVTGNTIFTVSLTAANRGAVEITGNAQSSYQTPNNTGVMLHVTGADDGNSPSRIYNDGVGQYALYTGRRFNGTISSPTQVLANQDLVRYGVSGYTSSGWPALGTGRLSFVASENYTLTAQGSRAEFWLVANTSNVVQRVVTIDPGIGVVSNIGIVAAGNLTANGITVTSNASITGFMSGKYVRTVRNAGTIADGGTLTIDFSSDAVVYCTWGNGLNIAYSNYMAGRVVKVMCTKSTGTGTDTLNLDGVTPAQVSTGTTTVNATADTTTFIELTCVNGTLGGVYVKL